MANAFEAGFTNSVAVSGQFKVATNLVFSAPGYLSNGTFQVQFTATPGLTYILQSSTNLNTWVSLSTNTPASSPFLWVDPAATNSAYQFYRVIQAP